MSTEVSISHFKSHCLEIIKDLQISHKSLIITNRNKPVAKIQPFGESEKISIFGIFKDKAKIQGDIIAPINENWSAEQ